MDTTDFDRPIIAVPSDDGSIDRAIEDLDARISEWAQAMKAAHDAVRQRAADANRRMAAETAAEGAAAVDATRSAAQASADRERIPPAPTPAPPSEKPGLRVDHLQGADAKPKTGIRAFETPEPETKEPTNSRYDEDEALLATLDPKLARQIKIKRRLCNGTKSIRELLAEGT